MLDGVIYDSIEAKTLSENRDKIDIFSLSWGPDDNGELLDGPRDKGSRAIEHGVQFGRQGKGSLFIFGSGNGHIDGDNCGADGYANSMFTITFAAADFNGKKAMYCERCSAILSTIYSSGGYGQLDRLPKISTLDVNGTCDEAFGGTSAVNPIASGIIGKSYLSLHLPLLNLLSTWIGGQPKLDMARCPTHCCSGQCGSFEWTTTVP